jgi:hypothetical protein
VPSARTGLLAVALVYNAGHHLGLLPAGLGDAGGATRWGDWLELLLPWALLGSAVLTLAVAEAVRAEWVVGLLGAVAYAQGTGIHLAANSIGNARGDAAPVHLWDEVVGHALTYGGVALVALALAEALTRTDVRSGPVALALSVLSGVTWATNVLGADDLALPGLAVALALAARGWALRGTGIGRLVLVAFATGAAGIASALVLG